MPGTQESCVAEGELHPIRIVCLATLGLTLPLAWDNLRRRRSDRRGAVKIAFLVFAMRLVLYGVQHGPPSGIADALSWLADGLQAAVFLAFLVWLYYIGLEPHVRRYWPHSLISWARLVTGRLRDPLVGRDAVIGCALGAGMVLIMQAAACAGLHSNRPYAGLVAPVRDWNLGRLSGYGFTVSSLADATILAISQGFLALALMLLLQLIVRRRWLAVSLFFAALLLIYLAGMRPVTAAEYVGCGLLALIMTLTLDRAGFLALVVGFFVSRLLIITPLTIDPSRWYAGQSLLVALVILLLLGSGWYASRSSANGLPVSGRNPARPAF